MPDVEIRSLERKYHESPGPDTLGPLNRARQRAGLEPIDPEEEMKHHEILSHLNCDAIDSKPIDIDWREAAGEDMEGWHSLSATTCEECGRTVVCDDGEFRCHQARETWEVDVEVECGEDFVDEDGDECSCDQPRGHGGDHGWSDGNPDYSDEPCQGYIYAMGPSMNYYYPLRGLEFSVETAAKLAGHCLCLVEVGGTVGMCLEAGGMDLTWEIVAAHLALGYRPPVHFCGLPRMGDRGQSADDRLIIRACLESIRIQGNWAENKASDLRRMLGVQAD